MYRLISIINYIKTIKLMYFAFDGNVAEWLRRGLQILITLMRTYIISPLNILFTLSTDFKCSPGPLLGHFDTQNSSNSGPNSDFKFDEYKKVMHP